jgi:2-iminobutanoate/2-iminopropanoate deaminase
MSQRIAIETDDAPKPVGPYSQGIKCGDFVFLAGQIGLDPLTQKFAGPTTGEQAAQALQNIETLLQFSGSSLGQAVRIVVYLVDLKDTQVVNELFAEKFYFQPPARTTVQVAALPGGARIEIEATAFLSGNLG